jgi:hypothetical protein
MFKWIHFRCLLILPVVGSSLIEISPASSFALINPEVNGHHTNLM